jgi:hypothetical protein
VGLGAASGRRTRAGVSHTTVDSATPRMQPPTRAELNLRAHKATLALPNPRFPTPLLPDWHTPTDTATEGTAGDRSERGTEGTRCTSR